MSGGSFGYLCWKRGSEIRSARQDVVEMRETIASMGDVPGVAEALADLDAMLALIDTPDPLDAIAERLMPALKAVEWWKSCDRSEADAREELAKLVQSIPVRPLTVFLPPQPEGTDMEALGETVRRIVESAQKGGGA